MHSRQLPVRPGGGEPPPHQPVTDELCCGKFSNHIHDRLVFAQFDCLHNGGLYLLYFPAEKLEQHRDLRVHTAHQGGVLVVHVVVVEVALVVVMAEAMEVAAVVGTISVRLAFGGDALGLFDHGVVAVVGKRVAQGETQWKPYYTTPERQRHDFSFTSVCSSNNRKTQILRGVQNSTVQSVCNERSWLR